MAKQAVQLFFHFPFLISLQSNSDPMSSATSSPNNLNAGGKPLAICVRNLPLSSTDTSLKDGLFHEYKKYGNAA